jgi:hypothetical protein
MCFNVFQAVSRTTVSMAALASWGIVFPLFTIFPLFTVGLSGCGGDDPMKRRMAEFRYTTDQLAEELVPRLAASKRSASRANTRVDEATRQMAEIEADRGGDGDRPDPNSLDAIVADVAVKLNGISSGQSSQALAEELVQLLTGKQGVDESVLSEFKSRLLTRLK